RARRAGNARRDRARLGRRLVRRRRRLARGDACARSARDRRVRPRLGVGAARGRSCDRSRHLSGSPEGATARPYVQGVPAAALSLRAARPRVLAIALAPGGVGVRLLRRHAHRRRPRPAPARQARSGVRSDDRNRAQRRLQARDPGEAAMMLDHEYVLRTVEERDIRFIRLWFTDVLGFLKSFAITPAELETAFDEGMGFDGSAIEGFARVQESDMVARPDPTTFQILPWRPG